jgi:exodeoxyribonuclease VII large subunit
MEQIELNLGPPQRHYTVSELTADLRLLFDDHFSGIWVSGEISGCKASPSGHVYFTLKDESAQMQCVCYRGDLRYLRFKPKDGVEVMARGRLDLYEQRGNLQFIVQALEPQGHGALQVAFEQLKKKLSEEGLFEAARKRPLPKLPERIGVVTSPTGAVIQDILRVLHRRFPGRHVRIYPAQVQGEGSAEQVCRGLRYFSESGWAEVVILARGGGSLEDLWTFNEEAVARAIAASSIPVISAIGHETDFTIADFVADLRAPTPSVAAEMAVPTLGEMTERIAAAERHALQSMRYRIANNGRRLHRVGVDRTHTLAVRMINRFSQRIDEAEFRLREQMRNAVERRRRKLADLERQLRSQDIRLRLSTAHARLADLNRAACRFIERRLDAARRRHATETAHLTQLSPLRILERGYAIVQTRDGTLVKSPAIAPIGTGLRVRLAHGELAAVVTENSE